MGVPVGKKIAVGSMGWNGVAVAVGLLGLYKKSGFMLTAAGAIGKLQAESKMSKANNMKGSLLRIDMGTTGDRIYHIYY